MEGTTVFDYRFTEKHYPLAPFNKPVGSDKMKFRAGHFFRAVLLAAFGLLFIKLHIVKKCPLQ
ncbi:hypothetical protein BAZO_06294 [Schinkia azotoformans LMG 9581]|uniref:Uncharacterized protein n=1 Tax=Schinkia azotoformans LMG 9581 TaxID=1131731 RepID=K6E4E9_SCHAZ|nr:hypothetical protein BAZO_06294 [Schinkia azotoformans LMG 9581]